MGKHSLSNFVSELYSEFLNIQSHLHDLKKVPFASIFPLKLALDTRPVSYILATSTADLTKSMEMHECHKHKK